MAGKRTVGLKNREILDAWLRNLKETRLLLGKPAAIEAQFGSWLILLSKADEAESLHELHRLVAIHSRNHGLQKRPASSSLRQILCLWDALEEVLGALDENLKSQVQRLLMIVSDGHFLGYSQQLEHGFMLQTRDFTPVIQLSEDTVLAFLFLPNRREVLDACYGRAMKMAGMRSAKRVIIDISDHLELNQRFYDTTKALRESREMKNVEIVFTGLDPQSLAAVQILNLPDTKVIDELCEILYRQSESESA